MLVEARRLAIEAGDTGLFENSVAAIAEAFAVVELQMLAEGWEELLRKSRPLAVNKLVAEHALAKLEDEVSREDFDQASRLSKLALDAARKSRDNAVLKLAVDRDKRLATEQQQWQAMQAAFNTLKQQPDDPAANLLVGRNLCFVKGEWERGLAMLAKGSDAVLKDLATQSQTAPTAPAAQSELGDAWWKAAEAAKGNSKTELQAGAGYWYLMALPNISGLGKVKLEQRLKQIGLTVAANPSSGQPTRSLPTSPAGQPAAGLHPADAIAGGGHFYKAFTENISWNEAKLKCEKMGGYLVCITSAEENNFVIQVVESFIGQNMLGTENKKYYLGAFLENDEWKWVNGEPFNYTPNALSKDPARPYLRHARDRWMIASNVSTLVSGYVCEWDANTATKQKSPGLPVAKLQSERQIAEALWAARCRIALEVQGKRTGYLQEGATLPTTDFSVVEVRFDHNEQLGDQAIPALRGLPKLDKLMLNCRYVTDVGMASVAPLRGVRDLTLDGSQITDEGLSALKSLENLELLSMKSTAITGSGLASLRGHSKLRHLDLNSCRNFGDQGMTHLATLKSLGRLDLRNTQVTDAGIASLRGLKNIFQLEVSPATTDASLGVLTTFVGLKRLQLRDSQISDAGFAKLKAALPGCDVSR